ncbi:MAG: hypothetical protein BWK79_08720 [Beggiatoa sp. IS2]|nr:MAG: hypothetical protein BWK79_08720 [Beggiatoa sp. IS2]
MPSVSNSYDDLPYTCVPSPRTQPQRLATVATFFGMTPPPVPTSRVLEIGCADGSNTIAMGYTLPAAQCVGIDLSTRQITQGQSVLNSLFLPNVTLKQMNILEFNPQLGQFDYIIAHGVYSWVPEVVQEKILQICQQHLSPQGVAYISYNTRPGWNMRSVIRDMMLYHTQHFAEPGTQIKQMKALLEFLVDAVKDTKTLYSIFLQKELGIFKSMSESYLFHEFLEEYNQPIYFHEFVERVEQHGLKYLGDTEVHTMFSENISTQVAEKLQGIGLVHQEQYLDFLNNRMFRHSLVCHQAVALQRYITPASVSSFCFASQLEPLTEVEISSSQPQKFAKEGLGGLEEDLPLAKATLTILYQQWPQAVKFADLVQQATVQLSNNDYQVTEQQELLLAEVLLKCYLGGVIEVFTTPLRLVTNVSAYPTASALARWQVQHSSQVATLRCEQLELTSSIFIRMLPYIDGQRDETALLAVLQQLVIQENIPVYHEGEPIAPEAMTPESWQRLLQILLKRLAKLALLVA